MAEQFLTLMADLDDESQARMAGWYDALKSKGFTGVQTPGLPYHISLATFALDREETAAETARKAAAAFAPVPVHISHIGIFPGGRVLFGGPERSLRLDQLHEACDLHPDPQRPWTPHVTILMEELDRICAAVPLLLREFRPFVGRIVRLHLCAFWPAREIISVPLTGVR